MKSVPNVEYDEDAKAWVVIEDDEDDIRYVLQWGFKMGGWGMLDIE